MLRPLCLGVLLAAAAYAGVSVDIRVGLGEFYRQPQHDIIVLEERAVPPDELPVVLFIAGRAGVPPLVIWEHRRAGLGWARIAARYGVTLPPAMNGLSSLSHSALPSATNAFCKFCQARETIVDAHTRS